MTIIEEIHAEIDTAQDRLLNDALLCIESLKGIEKKFDMVKRLKQLGFNQTEIVVESDEALRKRDEALNKSKLICYYIQTYPFLKFLTVDELERICDKYGLVYAPVGKYLKNVPEKNLEDIERSQPLKESDTPHIVYTYEISYFQYVPQGVREFFKTFESDTLIDSDSGLRAKCPIKYEGDYLYLSGGFKANKLDRNGLFIAAPKPHFDLVGLKTEKRGFFNFEIVKAPEPKDPIVFRYVKGGIQVLTKWGAEAEDPALLNPINN